MPKNRQIDPSLKGNEEERGTGEKTQKIAPIGRWQIQIHVRRLPKTSKDARHD